MFFGSVGVGVTSGRWYRYSIRVIMTSHQFLIRGLLRDLLYVYLFKKSKFHHQLHSIHDFDGAFDCSVYRVSQVFSESNGC